MYNLKESEIGIIEDFSKRIRNSNIGNEDKVYIKSYIDSMLSNNFIGASKTGFTFLEKYLRTKLIFIQTNENSTSDNWLLYLDNMERKIEKGEDENSQLKLFNKLGGFLQKYGNDSKVTRKFLHDNLDDFLNLVDKEGVISQKFLSFHSICKELKESGYIKKELKEKLSSKYNEYRNPLHHGLFKKLVDFINGPEEVTEFIYQGGIDTPGIKRVSGSNFILREGNDSITPISRRISVELFYLIDEVIDTFGDYKK